MRHDKIEPPVNPAITGPTRRDKPVHLLHGPLLKVILIPFSQVFRSFQGTGNTLNHKIAAFEQPTPFFESCPGNPLDRMNGNIVPNPAPTQSVCGFKAVPHPQNESNTTSPGFDDATIIRVKSFKGFCVS